MDDRIFMKEWKGAYAREGRGSISRNRENVVIDCTTNTNLISPKTKIKVIEYELKKELNCVKQW